MDDQFESLLQQMNESLQKNEQLTPSFCTLTKALETFPESEFHTKEIEQEVTSLFKDINKQIELYDRQFEVLQQELGVLCPTTPSPIPTQFFEGLLSLFRLAYGTYKPYPEVLNTFLPPLQIIVNLLKTSKFTLEGRLLEQALLLQLIKSAWAFTKSPVSQEQVANQLSKQGGFRNKTRKLKRKV